MRRCSAFARRWRPEQSAFSSFIFPKTPSYAPFYVKPFVYLPLPDFDSVSVSMLISQTTHQIF
jgi:hypothetical protein